jgi:hypothetical protein
MDVVSNSGAMKKEFERRLEKITAKVKAKGIAVESEVTHGHVALEIERAIRGAISARKLIRLPRKPADAPIVPKYSFFYLIPITLRLVTKPGPSIFIASSFLAFHRFQEGCLKASQLPVVKLDVVPLVFAAL